VDPKTGKTSKKQVEVEVIKVDTKSKTVTVKDLATKAKHTDVAWSDLIV
jgi:hypothetical protein